MTEFADRLNVLFLAFRRPATADGQSGEPWTNTDVARLAAERGPGTAKPVLTRQYLGMLRSGERAQPSLVAANAIAGAFAELSGRVGHPEIAAAILSYLAGEYQELNDGRLDPQDVFEILVGERPGLAGMAVSMRLGEDEPQSLRDIVKLVDRLDRPENDSARRLLTRLLGRRPGRSAPRDPH